MKRDISSFSLLPSVTEAVAHYADATGRTKSNAAEHLLKLALKTPPKEEQEDIRLAKLTGEKVNRNVYFSPAILKRALYEADLLSRPLSHVISRAVFDQYGMKYSDL
jgi:hypothetical protein